jgi:uncharacterized membrane protein YccF (DUF307 family)
MSSVVVETRQSPGCLIQLIWFALVGWWLGQAWVAVAWFFMITVVGLPVGIAMLNALPKVIALRESDERLVVTTRPDGSLSRRYLPDEQAPFLLRALWFLLVGWWLSGLWIEAAFAISLTVIGLPIGFWMFDRVPGLLTLKR